MFKKIFFVALIIIISIGYIQKKWIHYGFHLLQHQLYIFNHKVSINQLHTKQVLHQKTKNNIQLITNIKNFGKNIYQLNNTKSFEYYVKLPRKQLGWILVLAHPYELKLKEFKFPFLGGFTYLGFFNKAILKSWMEHYKQKEFDVSVSTMGAYSTLGILDDPIFSSYLEGNKKYITRLILHEMAHEKYYFKNDSTFSEAMASFIEVPTSKLFVRKYHLDATKNKMPNKKSYKKLQDVIQNTKNELNILYKKYHLQQISKKLVKNKKEQIFRVLQNNLKKLSVKYPLNKNISRLAQINKWNNALLLQISRYEPKIDNFNVVFNKICKENVLCWFKKIQKLEKCTKEERKHFIYHKIKVKSFLENCKSTSD